MKKAKNEKVVKLQVLDKLYGVWYKSTQFNYEKWYTKSDGACIFSLDKREILATVFALRGSGANVSLREVADNGYPVGHSRDKDNA